MIVPKMNYVSITWKKKTKPCPAKQSIHFISENEKHINHGMSGRAEEKQPKEKKETWRPLWSGLCHHAQVLHVKSCKSRRLMVRVSVEGRTSQMFQIK